MYVRRIALPFISFGVNVAASVPSVRVDEILSILPTAIRFERLALSSPVNICAWGCCAERTKYIPAALPNLDRLLRVSFIWLLSGGVLSCR